MFPRFGRLFGSYRRMFYIGGFNIERERERENMATNIKDNSLMTYCFVKTTNVFFFLIWKSCKIALFLKPICCCVKPRTMVHFYKKNSKVSKPRSK